MGHYVYVRNKGKKAYDSNMWPESKKIEAVTAYLSLGTLPLAAALVKVPLNTVIKWKKQPWWIEMTQKIQEEDNQELDVKFSKIIKKTLDVIEDRLENGNFQMDQKTGRVLRIPVNVGDSHRIMSDLVDKRKVIRHEPTQIKEKKEQVNDRLINLAEQFAKFAMGKDRIDDLKEVKEVYENLEDNTNIRSF